MQRQKTFTKSPLKYGSRHWETWMDRPWQLVERPESKPFYHDDQPPTDDHVEAMAFHPSLPELAVIGHSGRISFFEIPSGRVIRRIEQELGGRGHSLAYSPNSRYLAACSAEDRPLRIWNTHDWSLYREIVPTKEYVTGTYPVDVEAIAYHPGGDVLAMAGGDTVYLWDIEHNTLIREIKATPITPLETCDPGDWIECVAFSPDGKTLLAGTRFAEYELIAFEQVDERRKQALEQGNGFSICQNAFLGQGPFIRTDAGRVWAWDMDTGNAIHSRRAHDDQVKDVAFLDDEKSILSVGFDGCVNVWNRQTFEPTHQWRRPSVKGRYQFFLSDALSTKGRWYTNSWLLPFVIDLDSGEPRFSMDSLPEHTSGHVACLSPDEKWLALSRGVTVVLWDLEKKRVAS